MFPLGAVHSLWWGHMSTERLITDWKSWCLNFHFCFLHGRLVRWMVLESFEATSCRDCLWCFRFPNPDPAELTSQEPGAEGASSLPRGPLIGSAPRGRLSLHSGPLLFPPVPRQEFRDHRSCTCGRRHPLFSSLEM